MSNFRDRLKTLRQQKDLTQDELAAELDISRSAISMYERGEREPDFETLEKIADYFNVDMNFLTGWSDDPIDYNDPDLIASIPLAYMEACGGDVKRAFHMMQAVDQDYAEELQMDDFTYALRNEAKGLTDADKELLLSMARQLKKAREKTDGQIG